MSKNSKKAFEERATAAAKKGDAHLDKIKSNVKKGVKNAASNYKEGFADAVGTSTKMVFGALSDVIQGKNPMKGLVKEGVSYGKRTLNRTVSTIKGFFNDPKWYEYHGENVNFAANELRPFSPKQTGSIQKSSNKNNPGPGITHVIQNNIVWGDVFDSEAFDLATAEAFRIIREELKSNLPYNISQFRSFLQATITLIAGAKALEKTLGWYTAVREDMPELHDAMTSTTVNPSESGRVAKTPILCIADDTAYSATLNAFNILKNYCAQIAVPVKLVEYISWWVGGTFIDQSQPNAQLYTNMLRDAPIYTFSSTGELIEDGRFDIATIGIYRLIDQAKSILNTCGVINADLIKSSLYGYLGLISPEEYNCVGICDYEFFNVLINSYNIDENSSRVIGDIYDSDYVRVDILPEVDKAHSLGAVFAVANKFGINVPFRVLSQAAYLSILYNGNMIINKQGILAAQDAQIELYSPVTNDLFLQLPGYLNKGNSVDILIDSTPAVMYATYDNKFDGAISGITVTETEWTTARYAYLTQSPRNPAGINLGWCSQYKYVNIRLNGTTGTMYYNCSSPYSNDGTSMTITWPNTVQFGQSTDAQGYAIYYMRVPNGANISVTNATARQVLQALFTNGSTISRAELLFAYRVKGTTSSTRINYRMNAGDVAGLFCELVDYHMPILTYGSLIVFDSTSTTTLEFKDQTKMLKECYVPMSLNEDNVRYIIYHMLLGLFSAK